MMTVEATRIYRLSAEQPTLVALGKRPGSPYADLLTAEFPSSVPAPVLGKLLIDVIEPCLRDDRGNVACWLYSPISNLIRRPDAPGVSEHIHLAFTNPAPGRDDEYNAWYSGEHLTHALTADGFVSAQRFSLSFDLAIERPDINTDSCDYEYLTLYGLQTRDLRASEDDMHQYATGQKPGMPLSDAIGPVRATWVYSPF